LVRAGRLAAASAAISTIATACLPAAATTEGRAIGDLYAGFFALALVVAAVVFGLTTFAILRYRSGSRDDLPEQVRGNTKAEIIWTAIPVLAIAGLFIGTLVVLNRVEARSERPAAEIRVEAFRWGWRFSYPAEGVAVSGIGDPGPEAVVPVGEPVRVTLAAHDVVHAFYVPVFLFKRDAIPGRESTFEFTVESPGTYRGQCAEFCGIYHSRMPFTIRAVSRAEYEAWLASQPSAGASPPPAGAFPSPSGATP
jgi:cytochrome c oxidase subunit 2